MRADRDPHAGGSAAHHRQAPRSTRRQHAGGRLPTLAFFGPQFFEEFGGLSTRRLLELAQSRAARAGRRRRAGEPEEKARLHLDAGRGARLRRRERRRRRRRARRRRSISASCGSASRPQSEAEIPSDDQELHGRARPARWRSRARSGAAPSTLTVERLERRRRPARHRPQRRARDRACRPRRASSCATGRPRAAASSASSTGVLPAMQGKSCFMLRASDFPPNKKNQTAQAFRKFREGGGRSILVPIPEWERMMTVREFHAQHRHDPGFADWFEQRQAAVRTCSPLVQLLRLDLLRPAPRTSAARRVAAGGEAVPTRWRDRLAPPDAMDRTVPTASAEPHPANDDELPLSVLLDENGDSADSILAGREIGGRNKRDHAQQERAEAPRRGARRLRLGQDDAGAVHHRAAAAARHAGGADRPQGRSVLLRQPGRLARASRASSASGAASARSSPTPSTSPSTRRAAPRAGRSRSRCCPTASTSCPSTSSSCSPTCRRRRSATCCT